MRSRSASRSYAIAQNADINVTPFVDVMLVLLIVTMIAAPLSTVALQLELPPPCAACQRPQAEPVIVSIAPGGALTMNQGDRTAVSRPDTLRADLARFLGNPDPAEAQVVLRAERTVRYQGFMDVMNTLRRAGYRQVSLLSEPTQRNP